MDVIVVEVWGNYSGFTAELRLPVYNSNGKMNVLVSFEEDVGGLPFPSVS